MPKKPMSERARTLRFAAEFAEQETWPREKLLALQHHGLRRTIATALLNSSYYRSVIGALGNSPRRLQDFPIMNKSILMEEFDRIVTDPRLNRALVEDHLAHRGATVELFGKYHVFPTGGSTGVRSMMVYDRTTRLIGIANMLNWLRGMGVGETTKVIGIGAATSIHVSNHAFHEIRKSRPDAPRLDVTMPLARLVEALNAYQPEVLITYPSLLREFALEQLAGRLSIAPRRCSSVSETLSSEVRRLAFEAWKTPVINNYGATETGTIGSECEEADGIHLLEELLVVEIVDEDYQPVPPGVVGERMLVTTLFNPVMPLIRYEISDRVALAGEPCRCGRPHWRLSSIEGRREEILDLPAKDGGIARIPAVRLRDPLLLNPGLRQYQVEARPEGLHVRVVLGPETSDPTSLLESLRQAIAMQLNKMGAMPILTIETVDRIERITSSGKAPLVTRPNS
jgi:phenylacetate-coenzyme A ligase PaaK-like adenylate-forming protein